MTIHRGARDHADILLLLATISSSSFIWNLLIVKVRIFSAIHMWDIMIEINFYYLWSRCVQNQ